MQLTPVSKPAKSSENSGSTAQCSRAGTSKDSAIAYAVLAGCLFSLIALHLAFLHANGPTYDEFMHLQAGYRYWECGEFADNPEHPPLPKLIAGFPIRNEQLDVFPAPCGVQTNQIQVKDLRIPFALSQLPNARKLLNQGRTALLVVPLVLLLSVFFATKSWFGNVAAGVAALLVTFEPTLVAHRALVTSDAAITTFGFVAVWLAMDFTRKPSILRFSGAAVGLGLSLASKHSALALPGLLLVVILTTWWMQEKTARSSPVTLLGAWAGMCAVSVFILWCFYGLRYSAVPGGARFAYDFPQWFHAAGLDSSFLPKVILQLAHYRVLPEAYLAGLADIVGTSERSTYLLGRMHETGVWYYFPVAILIKSTVGLLMLFFLAVASPEVWRKHKGTLLPLLVAVAGYLALGVASSLNIGVRHVLPVYPLLIVVAAAAVAVLIAQGRNRRIVVLVLLAGALVSGMFAAPRQISYSNELFGGPSALHYLLADSNLDWGQSADDLTKLMNASGQTDCAYAAGMPVKRETGCIELPTFLADGLYGTLQPVLPDRLTGTLYVQPLAASFSDTYSQWLTHKPDEVLSNGTILVYRGDFDLRELAALRRYQRGWFLLNLRRSPNAAIEEFAAAEAFCPKSSRIDLEMMYTSALYSLGSMQEAQQHAESLLALTAGQPRYRRLRENVAQVFGLKP